MGNVIPRHFGPYREGGALEEAWRALACRVGATESVAGHSVEGRPLWRFDLGTDDQPSVLLTALIHGNELIGSEALFHLVETLALPDSARPVLDQVRLVILPVMNPDALAANTGKLMAGERAWQRWNRRGVDLNRNFPVIGQCHLLHPFSGSAVRWSPYYAGPHPGSEPETHTLVKVAKEVHPALSLGFHSFGNMLLYPWGHTRRPSPRRGYYRRITQSFVESVRHTPYKILQASHLYPVTGDLDDWLEARFGTTAFTVEVSQLDCRLLDPRRLLNPFSWMNPVNLRGTVRNLTPGLIALMDGWVRTADV
ncbi:MAG: succinylglutamate desuccinylase/aspartoacylase family protein [Deltaproteobacteria bacterium]|nr:succinylglutamate desuccinylase/aspartoacylase family protein [Deltaproteobacteria bacterium]